MSFAYMPLYTGDYLRDTSELSLREHGAYLMLLAWCWQRAKGLPSDRIRIYSIAHAKDTDDRAAVDYVLKEFFSLGSDGLFHNGRLEREIERHNLYSQRGKAGADARWHAKAMQDGCLNDAQHDAKTMTPSPSPITTTSTTKPKTLSAAERPPPRVKPELWREWAGRRRKALTEPAYKRQCAFLALQADPNACIEQSLRNDWAGLFEVRERDPPKTDKRARTAREMYGTLQEQQQQQEGTNGERDITGDSKRIG